MHRYWWFVVFYQFVVTIALIVVAATGALRSQRASWIGLLSVALILYISMTEAFYSVDETTNAQVRLPAAARRTRAPPAPSCRLPAAFAPTTSLTSLDSVAPRPLASSRAACPRPRSTKRCSTRAAAR